MAAYEYIALDARGKQKKGVLEADSVRQIRQLLRDQGLVPLEVDAARERSGGGGFSLADFGRRLSALDRVLFTRQLATLIAAGLCNTSFNVASCCRAGLIIIGNHIDCEEIQISVTIFKCFSSITTVVTPVI